MKIAVIGGAGKVVWGAVRDFVENDTVEKVLLADLNIKALEEREKTLASEKVEICQLNLTEHAQLVKLLEQYDVCLNATIHRFNLQVMKACVESRTHYTDFGGLFHWAREQLEMHEQFEAAGITGIIGSGSAPGIVNVMARYGYERLDQVHSVKILDGIVNFNADPKRFIPPYAIETLLEEFEMNPYEFKDGEFVEMTPFSGEEIIDFPAPIGRQKVFNTIHSEVATIPISFQDKGIQNMAFKLSLPKDFEQKLRFLVDLGLGSKQEIKVKDQTIVPRQVLASLIANQPKSEQNVEHDDHKALRVEVSGQKDGLPNKYVLDCVIHPYDRWRDMSQGVFSVGFPAAVTARLLGSGQIRKRGFFPSEVAIDPTIYFKELSQRGIHVQASLIQQV